MKYITRIPFRMYLLLIAATAVVTRTVLLTKADVWHDEGYTMGLITHGTVDIIERTARDLHPPLYYLVLHWWQQLFGMSVVSVRGFSVICGVATVIVMYLLMRRLFNEQTARITGIILAFAPFLVRYSDEARMYAFVALLVACSSYILVRALEAIDRTHAIRLWAIYGVLLAISLYSQYYAIFIIPVHIAYTAQRLGGIKNLIANKRWWASHVFAGLLFLPWVPVIISQVRRVQAGYWIPPVTIESIPNTLAQFLIYQSKYSFVWEFLGIIVAAALLFIVIRQQPKLKGNVLFLVGWLCLPLVAVFVLSLKDPVYYDRYFAYSAVAFYALIAVVIANLRQIKKYQLVATAVAVGICLYGLMNVADQAGHQMGKVGAYVSERVQPGDDIISAELYTYFDFDYYNHSQEETKLLYKQPVSGYGETSLIYDQPDRIVTSLADIRAKRVWLVGKTGEHPYYTDGLPANWSLIDRYQAGDSAVRLYEIR